MARGKCINCRIHNATIEAEKHSNFITRSNLQHLIENRRDASHTLQKCKSFAGKDEEGNPVYAHRPTGGAA